MDDILFEKLKKAVQQSVDYAEGKSVDGVREYQVHVPESVNVAEIRRQLHMSQVEFSRSFGFPLGTLRKWENGQRVPTGASRVLLRTIAVNPGAVIAANMHG